MSERNEHRNAATTSKPWRPGIGARSFPTGVCIGAMIGIAVPGPSIAGPEGGQIVSGTASITQSGNGTTLITQGSDRLGIDWQSFNVGENETVRFDQPSAQAAALNRIFDQNPSRIFGALDANGHVYLVNPNGIVFGETARIDVGSLIASSLDMSLDDFVAGRYDFEAADGEGGLVVNRGLISAATGGSITLLGGSVANEGLIVADLGHVTLGAGSRASLDFDGDGLLFFEIDEAVLENTAGVESAVSNAGEIRADGGEVLLTARAAQDVFSNVVNNSGAIRAARIDDSGGVVRLLGAGANVVSSGTIDASGASAADAGGDVQVLGDRVGLLDAASIDVSGASGGTILIGGDRRGEGEVPTAAVTQVAGGVMLSADAGDAGDGGRVVVWADEGTWFFGDVSARGGTDGGDGGFVEISGKESLVFSGTVDTSAARGQVGTLLFDPSSISIVNGDAAPDDSDLPDLSNATLGTDAPFSISEGALEDLAGDSNIVLEATGNISMADLADNLLDLAITNPPGAGPIGRLTITADTDGDGVGAFSMHQSDSIRTEGGDVEISGAGLTVGGIDVTGVDGDEATGSIGLSSSAGAAIFGDLRAGGDVSVSVDTNDAQVAVLRLDGTITAATATLAGSDEANDLLEGDDAGADIFVLNAGNAGSLNGVDFTGFRSFFGLGGDDRFTVIATQAGAVDGGAGSDTVTLAEGVSVTGGLTGGSTGSDDDRLEVTGQLQNNWLITGSDSGTLNAVAFGEFENLGGGSGVDVFTFLGTLSNTASGGAGDDAFNVFDGGGAAAYAGDDGDADRLNYAGSSGPVTIAIDNLDTIEIVAGSASGNDTLQGTANDDTFVTSSADAGLLNGTLSYSSFEVLQGVAGDDTFHLQHAVSGSVNGGAGDDLFNLTANISVGGVQGGSGGADSDTLALIGGSATFTLTGEDAGTLNGLAFSEVENLTGTANADTFALDFDLSGTASGLGGNDTFSLGAGASAAVAGGAGTDGIEADTAQPTTFTVSSANTGSIANGGGSVGFESVENLTGGDQNDTFNLSADLGGIASGGAGDDDFALAAGVTAGVAGGAGSDRLFGSNAGSTFSVSSTDSGSVTAAGGVVSFSAVENLFGGNAIDTFDIDADLTGAVAGDAGDDRFNLGSDVSAVVSGDGGADTLAADSSTAAAFTVEASNAGTMANGAGNVSFAATENLVGSEEADTFDFDAALTGTASGLGGGDTFRINDGGSAGSIDGGGGTDTQSYAASSGAVTVAVGGRLSIENLVGSGDPGDTLQGTTGDDTFVTTGVDAGTVAGISYSSFETLLGLAGADVFTLNHDVTGSGGVNGGAGDDTFTVAGGVSIAVAGGEGMDRLAADASQATQFEVSAPDAGTAIGGGGLVSFSSVESLTGSEQGDTFALNAVLSGIAQGGAGSDIFDIIVDPTGSLFGGAGADTFVLTAGISAVVDGGGGSDTILADAGTPTSFHVDAPNAGTVTNGTATVTFTATENLTGSNEADRFLIAASLDGTAAGGGSDDVFVLGAGVSAALDGGDGFDVLQGADSVTAFILEATGAGTAASGAGSVAFAAIDRIDGGSAADAFTLLADFAGPISGGAGADVFEIDVDVSAALSAGDGNDRFALADGVVASGSLDGGAGSDTLDLSSFGSARNVVLTGTGAVDGFDGNEASAARFLDIDVIVAGAAGSDSLTASGGDAVWSVVGDGGSGISVGAAALGFTSFEILNGSAAADRFVIGAGDRSGNLALNGGGGSDSVEVAGSLTVEGDITLTAIEAVTATNQGAVLSANTLAIDGATDGIGASGNPIVVRLARLEVWASDTGLFIVDQTNGLEVAGAAMGNGDVEITVDEGDLLVGFIDAGGTGDPLTPPIAADGGDVKLVAAQGSIANGNGSQVNVRGRSADLRASLNIGNASSPITIVVPSSETITLAGLDATIDNIRLATVDDTLVAGIFSDVTANATAAALGASAVSSLQNVAAIDWAALDPNVTLVDCLEPCIRLPEDQLEDDGFGLLRDASKILLIRTQDGWKVIPVFEREALAAAY